MTNDRAAKAEARAYAAAHGVSYTAALRATREASAATQQLRPLADCPPGSILALQQVRDADGRLPYPLHIDAAGYILRQSFWRGELWRLVGFQRPGTGPRVDLNRDAFLVDPAAAVGLVPVVCDTDSRFCTLADAVRDVTLIESLLTERALDAHLEVQYVGGFDGSSTSDFQYLTTLDIGPALLRLPTGLLRDRGGWTFEQDWAPEGEHPAPGGELVIEQLLGVAASLDPKLEKIVDRYFEQLYDRADRGLDSTLRLIVADGSHADAWNTWRATQPLG